MSRSRFSFSRVRGCRSAALAAHAAVALACASGSAPPAAAGSESGAASEGLERYLPLPHDTVYVYDTLNETGDAGVLIMRVRRTRPGVAELGVAESDIELLAEGIVPDAEEQGMNQADDVLNRWDDVEGETVIWHQGHYDPSTGKGSGAEKIDQKHNLSMEVVRTVTRWPFTNDSFPDHTKTQENPPGGTSYRYQAEA